jgi:gamma-glutamyltranspeptidase/glutathione hydrolase
MRFLILLVALAFASCTHVEPPAATSSDARSGIAAVAAANPLAVEAGLEVLRKGGNAVDAAVAVQAMLGLVEPQSSGVGGGAFLVHLDAQTGEVTVLNGREKAPAGATPTMFLDETGKPLPFRQAVWSGRSTGVPGVMRMLEQAHGRLGKLPWNELFEPAIRTANEGFAVSPRLARFVKLGFRPETPDIKALFARPDGSPLQAKAQKLCMKARSLPRS